MSDYAPKTPAPMSNPAGMGKSAHNGGSEYAHPYLQLRRDAGAETPLPINRSAKLRPWQTKLRVGSANDPAEAEADSAAREVVGRGAASGGGAAKGLTQTKPLVSRIHRQVQRQEQEEEARDTQLPKETANPKLQRQEEEEASPKLQRQEEEEASPKLQRQEEEEASPKLQRQEEEEASPKLQRQEEEEASPKLMRQEEEAQAKCDTCEGETQRQEEEEARDAQLSTDTAQAKCADCEDEEEEAMPKQLANTQTQAESSPLPPRPSHLDGFIASQETHNLLKSRKGSGEPMPEPLKNEMETGFGADFSNVKIHRDSASTELNKDLKAKAFTHGEDVFFGEGQFDAGSDQGKELIAHELTHTIQQGAVVEKKPGDQPAENPAAEMARTMLPGNAVAGGSEAGAADYDDMEMGQVEQVEMGIPVADLSQEELEQQAQDATGGEGEAALDEAAGEGAAEGEVIAGLSEGEIPDVETESEIEMPSVEKQRIAGEISEFKGAQGETAEKGGEIGQFMATETENVCAEAETATDELAANESEHPEPGEEVAEVNAAEEIPDEFGQQMGNAGQVNALEEDGQDTPDADPADAKKAMTDQLDNDTPETLEDLDEMDPSATAGAVQKKVGGEIGSVKSNFGRIEAQAKPEEVPDAKALKPVAKARDTARLGLGQGVVPEVPQDMANMDSYQDDMDAVMAEEGISEEQMAMVDSGPLAEAQKGRGELKDKVANAPTELQEGARAQAKAVETEMDKEEDTARGEMKAKRKENLENVHGEKKKTKSKLEQEREKVTKQVEGMYLKTESKIKARLDSLEKENEERFGKAVLKYTEEFKKEVEDNLQIFKNRRYAGPLGGAYWLKDLLLGIDEFPEVQKFFKDAKDNYVRKIDDEIKAIIKSNNDVIKGCKDDLKKGKEEIDLFVSKLAPNLMSAGKKAAEEMSKKFEELDTFINEKQAALVAKLCDMKNKAIEHIDKVAEKMKEALSGALSQLIGLVVAALLKFFNWALGLFGYGMENLEETIVRTKRTLTFMVKHPIDFMGGLFSAVGMGFTQFGDNIQKHLISGLVMWLTGGMREEPIRLPDKWDLKGILFFIMEVLGLGWANLRKKLVKLTSEKAMTLAEKGLDIVMKLFTEGPIAMWEDIRNQGEELKGEIFAAVREMMIIEIIKQGVIFLLSLTNPASGIVKAIKAIYDFVMWFFNNIHRIIEMVKKVFEASANIVEGNLGGAANAIERIMGLTIPVIIDLFLSILGLGGLPKKVMAVIKKVGGKLNALIDKLLLKVAGVIKKMFGGKKGGGKKDPKKDGKNELTAADKRKHEKYVKEIGEELSKKESNPQLEFKNFHEAKKDKAKKLEKKYNSMLTKKANGKPIKAKIKFLSPNQDEKDNDVDVTVTIAPNTTKKSFSLKFDEEGIPTKWKINPGFNNSKTTSFEVLFAHKKQGNIGEEASEYKGNLSGSLKILHSLNLLDDKWVKFHIFNENLGGKATDSNLIPTRKLVNNTYKSQFENKVKDELHAANKVYWFRAQIGYHSSYPAFPSNFKAWSGEMKPDKSGNWKEIKKGINYFKWSDSDLKLPSNNEVYINRLTLDDDVLRLALQNSPMTLELAKALIKARTSYDSKDQMISVAKANAKSKTGNPEAIENNRREWVNQIKASQINFD